MLLEEYKQYSGGLGDLPFGCSLGLVSLPSRCIYVSLSFYCSLLLGYIYILSFFLLLFSLFSPLFSDMWERMDENAPAEVKHLHIFLAVTSFSLSTLYEHANESFICRLS